MPKVTDTLRDLLEIQEKKNPKFVKERDKFLKLCHDSINPEVTKADVREMIIQHILTEDIFNTIFDETQFHRENNIAHQLEGVINTFFTGATKRTALSTLQHYSQAINAAAAGIADHHEKQKFLKVVYETFYKSYNPKAADRLGVVYTPNEIVKFMIESTDYLLHKHFGKFLEDKGVDILDVATGTGTFVCDIIDYIRKEKLEYKYKNELHANEVAILPYYISNLNIEFTYTQKMGKYSEFENLCFVDTLDNMGFAFRGKQIDMFAPFTEENSKRIHKQNTKRISVVIGNPPYNANQVNENENNKNREYPEIDKRIKDTFIKYSTAQKTKVYDMYARFYRWAMDRLDDNGIIAFVTNRSFIDSRTFDGFRKCVQDEFDYAYIIDTKSDVRANPKISGTGHNVFGIQTGVAILILVKKASKEKKLPCKIHYTNMQDEWRKEQKLHWFTENPLPKISFDKIQPDKNNNWINLTDNDFDTFLPLCSKEVKSDNSKKALFKIYSTGVLSSRDEWVYDLNNNRIKDKVDYFINFYNKDIDIYKTSDLSKETLLKISKESKIKWSDSIRNGVKAKRELVFEAEKIRRVQYRPFSKKWCYFDETLCNTISSQPTYFFDKYSTNSLITITQIDQVPFTVYSSNQIIDHGIGSRLSQSLPLSCFDKNGNKIDNITDWGLNQFVKQYGKKV